MTDRKKHKPMPSLDPQAFAMAAVPQPDPVQVATARAVPVQGRGEAVAPAPPSATVGRNVSKAPSRAGKVQLNVWVSPQTRQKLLHRKADTGQSIEEMVSSAIEAMLSS